MSNAAKIFYIPTTATTVLHNYSDKFDKITFPICIQLRYYIFQQNYSFRICYIVRLFEQCAIITFQKHFFLRKGGSCKKNYTILFIYFFNKELFSFRLLHRKNDFAKVSRNLVRYKSEINFIEIT